MLSPTDRIAAKYQQYQVILHKKAIIVNG